MYGVADANAQSELAVIDTISIQGSRGELRMETHLIPLSDWANRDGMHTRSSLQIGIISTEYVNL